VRDLSEQGNFPVTLFEERKTGQRIVVKAFRHPRHDDLFFRELMALLSLIHPCIVPLFGYVRRVRREGSKLATHFMSGSSLEGVLRSDPSPDWFTPTAKAIIVAGIVIGMRHVHNMRFMHGDLKPSNILLDRHHRPRLADIGSSRWEANQSTLAGGAGIAYTAPELSGSEGYTNKIDVYSFALILYEILFGQPLLLPALTLINRVQRMRSPDANSIPHGTRRTVEMVIRRGLSLDAEARPSFAEIGDELQKDKFYIMRGVDCDAVLEYVEWARKCQRD
jgi:serine/threonine protein kinase